MGDSSDDEGVEMRREAVQEEDNDGDSDEEEEPAGKAAASDDDDDDDDDDDSSDEEEEERQVCHGVSIDWMWGTWRGFRRGMEGGVCCRRALPVHSKPVLATQTSLLPPAAWEEEAQE